MCGIQINKEQSPNLIQHRGTQHFKGTVKRWNYNFSSLPLSSNQTGLTQPLDLREAKLFFNGEIFNYKSFGNYRSDLHYLQDVLSSGIESKRFIKEYQKWDGFWAICIVADKVTMFTDPLGKKQLYYSNKGICSEIKPLLSENYMIMGEPKYGTLNTGFYGVQRCLPGRFYVYEYSHNLAYNINVKVKDYTQIKSQHTDLYELIDRSVKLRAKTSYGKLGLLFSGGLDSSIMAYHLKKNKIDFTAISIENGETEACKRMSKYLDFPVTYIDGSMTEEEKVEAFRMYENRTDLGSVLPQYKLFQKCKELDLHTVITGDGSDELFGGYRRAAENDTFQYDVFLELPYYHHLRIDRCSMAHTVECRNPFLSSEIIQFAQSLDRPERIGKKILRDIYRDKIPFVDMEKKPLRPELSKEEYIDLGNKYFNYAFKQ